MKTNFWKRAAALLLALVLCFACVGTASAAEDVSGKVYLIFYPRDGDENYHTGSWGHDALYFRHGWKLSASDYLDVRAIGSYDANICYCIEPGVIQNTGDAFSRMGEDFWENMPDFNDLMTPQQMKRFIGRIMTYGYTGGVSTQWRSQNAGGDKLAQAYATQLLIWEPSSGSGMRISGMSRRRTRTRCARSSAIRIRCGRRFSRIMIPSYQMCRSTQRCRPSAQRIFARRGRSRWNGMVMHTPQY